jgi:hypothetical protein
MHTQPFFIYLFYSLSLCLSLSLLKYSLYIKQTHTHTMFFLSFIRHTHSLSISGKHTKVHSFSSLSFSLSHFRSSHKPIISFSNTPFNYKLHSSLTQKHTHTHTHTLSLSLFLPSLTHRYRVDIHAESDRDKEIETIKLTITQIKQYTNKNKLY